MFTLVCEAADNAAAVLEQRDDRDFHIHLNALVDAMVLQSSYQFKTGSVTDVCEPRVTMSAEVSLQYLAVCCPVKDRSPRFEFPNPIGGFFRVQLGHSPVVDVLAAAHRVGEMHLPVVAVVDVRRAPPPCRPRPSRCGPCRAAIYRSARPIHPRRTPRSRRGVLRRRLR